MRALLIPLVLAGLAAAVPAAAADDTPEGGAWADCAVTAITLMRDRMVLKCGGPAGGEAPRMFALESSDRMVDPALRMALEAKARGKPLGVLYVKASMANPPGCAVADCRRLVAVESR